MFAQVHGSAQVPPGRAGVPQIWPGPSAPYDHRLPADSSTQPPSGPPHTPPLSGTEAAAQLAMARQHATAKEELLRTSLSIMADRIKAAEAKPKKKKKAADKPKAKKGGRGGGGGFG